MDIFSYGRRKLSLNNVCGFISYFLLAVFSLVNITGASAQTVAVLGELQSTGKVSIKSPADKWTPAMPTYPLLQGAGIRTEEGSTSVFFKDGSRVDLSRDTIVSISGEMRDYSIHLAKGVIAFSIRPLTSLSVSTPSAGISVNSKDGIVHKVGHNEKSSPVLGIIAANEKGTEVRNISGRITVTSSAAGRKTLVTGESMLVGSDSGYEVYKTQGVGAAYPGEKGLTIPEGALLFVGTTAGEGLIIYGLNDILSHNDHDKPKSPFTP
jgi:hypothetical protein